MNQRRAPPGALHVVIVDDDLAVARLESAILARHRVTLVTSWFRSLLGPDPWAGVDVAVVDLMLPGIPGEEIVAYLAETHPRIRRVVATAKPLYELEALLPLADAVLLKPFSPDQLLRAVEWTT